MKREIKLSIGLLHLACIRNVSTVAWYNYFMQKIWWDLDSSLWAILYISCTYRCLESFGVIAMLIPNLNFVKGMGLCRFFFVMTGAFFAFAAATI
jgi:hypothetical protein